VAGAEEHDGTVAAPEAGGSDDTLYGCPRVDSRGQVVIHPSREGYIDAVKALTDDGYTMCADLTAVDYIAFGGRSLPDSVTPERFEVVVNFLDIAAGRRIRVRVQVPEDEPTLPTLFDIHPGTEAMEREAFDMFGITFTDHPDLTRILMPEDWEGYPLRKDYEVGSIPVQFKDART
jgi:NADH-quinone oxidoreductase subunit C